MSGPEAIRDVVHLRLQRRDGDAFFFSYGCVVFWNIDREEERKVLGHLRDFASEDETAPGFEFDDFFFSYGDKFKIVGDEFVLDNRNSFTKLAISHAIAQSTRLSLFEEEIGMLIQKTKHLPRVIPSYLPSPGGP
jgi:uncharacterized Rmd1/YagE family protein